MLGQTQRKTRWSWLQGSCRGRIGKIIRIWKRSYGLRRMRMTNRAEPVQPLHHPASYGLLSLLPPDKIYHNINAKPNRAQGS